MSRDEGPARGAAGQWEGARRGGRGRDGHPQRPVMLHGDHATKGMAQRQPSVLTSGQILKMVPREGSLIPKAEEACERRQEDEGSKANVLAPDSVDRWGVLRPRLEAERPASHPKEVSEIMQVSETHQKPQNRLREIKIYTLGGDTQVVGHQNCFVRIAVPPTAPQTERPELCSVPQRWASPLRGHVLMDGFPESSAGLVNTEAGISGL